MALRKEPRTVQLMEANLVELKGEPTALVKERPRASKKELAKGPSKESA
jgi:hypothetical protein